MLLCWSVFQELLWKHTNQHRVWPCKRAWSSRSHQLLGPAGLERGQGGGNIQAPSSCRDQAWTHCQMLSVSCIAQTVCWKLYVRYLIQHQILFIIYKYIITRLYSCWGYVCHDWIYRPWVLLLSWLGVYGWTWPPRGRHLGNQRPWISQLLSFVVFCFVALGRDRRAFLQFWRYIVLTNSGGHRPPHATPAPAKTTAIAT